MLSNSFASFTDTDTLAFDTASGARYYVAGGHITRQSDEPILGIAHQDGHLTDAPLAVRPDGTLDLVAEPDCPVTFRLANGEPVRATRIRRFLRYVPAAVLAERLVDADPLAYYGCEAPAEAPKWSDLLDDVDLLGYWDDDDDAAAQALVEPVIFRGVHIGYVGASAAQRAEAFAACLAQLDRPSVDLTLVEANRWNLTDDKRRLVEDVIAHIRANRNA